MDRFRQFRGRFSRRVAPNNGKGNNGGWTNTNKKTIGGKNIQSKKSGMFGRNTIYRTKNGTPVYKNNYGNFTTFNKNIRHISNKANESYRLTPPPGSGKSQTNQLKNYLFSIGLIGNTRHLQNGTLGNINNKELAKIALKRKRVKNAAKASGATYNRQLFQILNNYNKGKR